MLCAPDTRLPCAALLCAVALVGGACGGSSGKTASSDARRAASSLSPADLAKAHVVDTKAAPRTEASEPKPKAPAPKPKAASIEVVLAATGEIRVDGAVVAADVLSTTLCLAATSNPAPAVHIEAAESVSFQSVVEVIDGATKCGLSDVRFGNGGGNLAAGGGLALPHPEAGNGADAVQTVLLSCGEGDAITIDGLAVDGADAALERLKAAVSRAGELQGVIACPGLAKASRVAQLIDLLNKAGVKKYAIARRVEPEPPPGKR